MTQIEEDTATTSQTKKPCQAIGCPKGGRTIGKLGDIELNYCGHHRKSGERVLNYLINSVFRYKLTDFLKETKSELFMDNIPEFCPHCYDVVGSYVHLKISQLDDIQKWEAKTK